MTLNRGLKPTATIIESLRDLSEMSKLQSGAEHRTPNNPVQGPNTRFTNRASSPRSEKVLKVGSPRGSLFQTTPCAEPAPAPKCPHDGFPITSPVPHTIPVAATRQSDLHLESVVDSTGDSGGLPCLRMEPMAG